ncbi:DUF5335 domain-containing protein [Bradyrhizobium stylosanthis]|uniref:Uncharacterized protein n=1 Tax=Bradyrhizobium stylosanthis TaxID=1803665 RepID=A0A560DFI5_9BRAD|nr:DUF5335 domain-containing protein [Bradyrhizobium stylosanthis]TWA95863.1 hypothetical protein FBZ96_10753 [Bradyrhizobium stylosanthis]
MAKKLEKSQWSGYFDLISKALTGKRAEIEVASLNHGDQIEAEWLPFHGISHDPRNDVVALALEGHDHLIHKPKEIYIEGEGVHLNSLEVIDADDVRQIVLLRDPLMLPAPTAAKAG